MEYLDKEKLLEALNSSEKNPKHNIAGVCLVLGFSRSYIYRWLKEYGIKIRKVWVIENE